MTATVIRHGWHTRMCGLMMSVMIVGSCTTSSIDTALTPEPLPPAPETVANAPETPETTTSLAPQTVPAQTIASQAPDPSTLEFPNINKDPVGEAPQLSVSDQQAIRDEAARAKQSVDVADETAAYAARLKKLKLLARTHAQRTQKQIEGN